jgi:two-component system chemotaxis response regulator CheB
MQRMERARPALPDAIVLDLDMPRMDGLTFLRKLMTESPIPVVICSGLTAPGTDLALQALAEGAVAVVSKQGLVAPGGPGDAAARLVEIVRAAASARPRRMTLRPARSASRPAPTRPAPTRPATLPSAAADCIVAVGASTGGTEAIAELLGPMPPDAPGLVIVQQMLLAFRVSNGDGGAAGANGHGFVGGNPQTCSCSCGEWLGGGLSG